jgi:hypothetical protein
VSYSHPDDEYRQDLETEATEREAREAEREPLRPLCKTRPLVFDAPTLELIQAARAAIRLT